MLKMKPTVEENVEDNYNETEGKDEEKVEEIYGGKIGEVRHKSVDQDKRELGEPGLERVARKSKEVEERREQQEMEQSTATNKMKL